MMLRTARLLLCALFLFAGAIDRPAYAQAGRPGTLLVTVIDPSGAIIPNATVTVAGAEDATRTITPAPVQTSPQGLATITGLTPGRYTVQAEFPGFDTRLLKDVRVRSGDNRQVVPLPIAGTRDAVDVAPDRQSTAVDPRGPSFGTTLTREQLDALSDDPDELRRQLQEMAGPGAVIRVDSFEGGALPSKAQIRSIRISRDQFAAENHGAGGVFVEVITQPGLGPMRYSTGLRFRSGALSGRSPFVEQKGPEQIRNYNLGISGTLIREKSSFNVFVNGMSSYDTPNINIAKGGSTRSEALSLRTPRDNINVNAMLDYALTLDQTLRFGYNMSRNTAGNLGIGAWDEEERAYATENSVHFIRAQHMGPLGRRAFTRSRLQVSLSDSETHAALEAPTIRVLDAFTAGGAQVAGGQHSRGFSFGTDLDYVRGIHTMRTGLLLDGSRVRADDTSNYLGTYTFESLAAYEAGTPRSYTRRIGDPNIRYSNLQTGIYVQDDMRVRRNLTLSAGVRYESQTHVADYNNWAPRFGATWSPLASGRTTLRASWGVFYDWLNANTYEQTLRVDGFRQQELDIVNPSYPEAPSVGTVTAVNRYLLGDDVILPRTTRVSTGIDQRLFGTTQASLTYNYQRGGALFRGLNLNAPVDGERPDETFGNVIAVVSDASSRQHQLQANLTLNPGALLPAPNQPRIRFQRITVFVNYTLARLRNNADGPFAVPATGSLIEEWGPGAGDVRHRFNMTFNNQIVRDFNVGLNFNGSSGSAYTIRTGLDGNGDLIFNDRPDGVGRNTLRTNGQWTVNLNVGYNLSFGRGAQLPPGIAVIGGGGGAPIVQSVDAGNARYRMSVFVNVQNLTNHANYTGYSGVLTSPFFGKPTTVFGTRKVDVGMNVSF